MMNLVGQHNMVQEEIFIQKGETVEDTIILQQQLVYDLARWYKRPPIVGTLDIAQCYGKVC